MTTESTAEQLTLSVSIRDDARFANYYAGPNAQVVHSIQDQWRTDVHGENAGEQFIFLWGSEGVGCSHLLQAACHYAEGLGHSSVYLPLDELVAFEPSVFEGLESLQLVALDHLQAIAGNPIWEEALFHLFNRLRESGTRLLVAADASPAHLNLELPDLISRLTWGISYQVSPLEDIDKAQALLLRAKQRGLNMPNEVANFILSRGSRKMVDICQELEELDKASLSTQRRLTIPFVKEVLDL